MLRRGRRKRIEEAQSDQRQESKYKRNHRRHWNLRKKCVARIFVVIFASALWCVCFTNVYNYDHNVRNGEIANVTFPKVVLRSNRREVTGYSLFLAELLSQHTDRSVHLTLKETNDAPQYYQTSTSRILEVKGSSSPSGGPIENLNEECIPGWLCQRCFDIFSFAWKYCKLACPSCAQCSKLAEVKSTTLLLRVPSSQTAIPRRVHFFWHDVIDSLRYPELARIQNGWRQMGVAVYTYTPETAREYIRSNYPAFMLRFFDSLESFDQQRNLLQLLLLLHDGGAFVDVTVMLETKLAVLFQEDVDLIVVRDPKQPSCVWTGFLAATPGNPVIVKALTRMYNSAMGYDLELYKWSCAAPGTRPQESLTPNRLNNGCGMTVLLREELNIDYHHQPDLLPLGMLRMRGIKSPRLLMVLLLDLADTGASRISLVDQNLLVASTNMLGLSAESMSSLGVGTLLRKTTSLTPKPSYTNDILLPRSVKINIVTSV